MAFGAKTAQGAELIPQGMGQMVPMAAFYTYDDGGAAPEADMLAAAAALPAPLGLRDEQIHQLVRFRMGLGLTWTAAKARLVLEDTLLTDALLDTFQARVNEIMAMNPPMWADTQASQMASGPLLDFEIAENSGLVREIQR